MAGFVDQPYPVLMDGAPKIVREGLSGTTTYVLPLPDKDRGLIVEYNARQEVIGTWPIRNGNAYRITPHKVRRMPLIENDPDFVRRFCRMNNLPLTRIKKVERGERVDFHHPHYQGDNGLRCVKDGEVAVKIVGCHTTGNPEYEWLILAVKGEEPKTWEEFCAIARNWREVQSGEYHL
ncbi:MAG: hypothetical protein PHT24_04255 [Endomicrobiaceae bacterium]|nr:hypothetical protein [Endomicrobiaceae bacterium]